MRNPTGLAGFVLLWVGHVSGEAHTVKAFSPPFTGQQHRALFTRSPTGLAVFFLLRVGHVSSEVHTLKEVNTGPSLWGVSLTSNLFMGSLLHIQPYQLAEKQTRGFVRFTFESVPIHCNCQRVLIHFSKRGLDVEACWGAELMRAGWGGVCKPRADCNG